MEETAREREVTSMFQTDLLKDKVILVTGGGTGLGRAMGERFLELGAKLAICGRRQEVAEQAAADMACRSGGETFATRCDVVNAINMLMLEGHLQEAAYATADHRESVDAFLHKRAVKFTGK